MGKPKPTTPAPSASKKPKVRTQFLPGMKPVPLEDLEKAAEAMLQQSEAVAQAQAELRRDRDEVLALMKKHNSYLYRNNGYQIDRSKKEQVRVVRSPERTDL